MHSLRFGEQNIGEYYHVFNRGNNKRDTFLDIQDIHRFLDLLKKKNISEIDNKPLVSILAFSILSNHFHLVIQQKQDEGIQKFMQKIGTAYTMYFNKKYRTTGALFQGRYKYILTHEIYLQERISYVNCNHQIHRIDPLIHLSSGAECLRNEVYLFDLKKGLSMFGTLKNFERISGGYVEETIKKRAQNLIPEDEL